MLRTIGAAAAAGSRSGAEVGAGEGRTGAAVEEELVAGPDDAAPARNDDRPELTPLPPKSC